MLQLLVLIQFLGRLHPPPNDAANLIWNTLAVAGTLTVRLLSLPLGCRLFLINYREARNVGRKAKAQNLCIRGMAYH
jgi:hypothetical protein